MKKQTVNKKFNPADYLITIARKQRQPDGSYKVVQQKYLEVKWRVFWFRQEHPDWSIETKPLEINTEKRYVIYRAEIKDKTGRIISTASKVETQNGFADYLEKAETGAVGRALALCGYGTQFAPELEEKERLVDAPVKKK